MSKLNCIPRREVRITDTETPEIAHLTPLNAESNNGGRKRKNCWEKLIDNLKKVLCVQSNGDELHPIYLRTQKTMEQLKGMIEANESTRLNQFANDMSKFQALNYPISIINSMIDQMKEIVLELTFSRHFPLKDTKLADLSQGKTMIGLYVWMSSYCFYQAGSGDKAFWNRFSNVASQSILLWSDILVIITRVERLRDAGMHIVRMMDKHILEVPLEKEGRKYRRDKDEMNKMKNFDHLKSDMAWGTDLTHTRPLRVLYKTSDPQSADLPWRAFEMLDSKTQYQYLPEILSYAELFFGPIASLVAKLKATTTEIPPTIRLEPYTDTDVILGMIVLDKLDLLTLAVKTLKLYVKEIRSTVRVCYEFCRYINQLKETKTYEEIEKYTVADLKHVNNVIFETPLTVHETSLNYNTQTYPDILQCTPMYTVGFSMVLQDLKDVFDMDALSAATTSDIM